MHLAAAAAATTTAVGMAHAPLRYYPDETDTKLEDARARAMMTMHELWSI